MTIEELNKAIRSGTLPPLLFFCGEEEYLAESRIAAIKKKLLPVGLESFNFAKLSDKVSADEIIEAAEVMPQGCDRRVVLVKDSGIFDNLRTAEFKKIKSYSEDMPEYVCLIFWEQSFDTKKMNSLKFIDDIGGIVNFERLPINKLEVWAEKLLQKADKTILARDLSYFIRISGNSMRKLHTECGKLIRYMGDDRHKVTRADIDAVVEKTDEVRVYDIFDKSIAESRGGKAKQQLASLKADNTSPQLVMSVLLDRVYELLMCKLLRGDGMSAKQILEYFDRKPPFFVVNKTIDASKRFSEEYLVKMVNRGLFYSSEMKTGRLDQWSAVELYTSELILNKK